MNLGAAPPALLPIVVCALALILGAFSWLRANRNSGPRSRLTIAMLGAVALAALASAVELMLAERPSAVTWRALGYLALGALPALAVALATARTHYPSLLAVLLALAGSFGFLAAATDDLHGLFGSPALPGPLYWAFVAVAAGLALVALIVFAARPLAVYPPAASSPWWSVPAPRGRPDAGPKVISALPMQYSSSSVLRRTPRTGYSRPSGSRPGRSRDRLARISLVLAIALPLAGAVWSTFFAGGASNALPSLTIVALAPSALLLVLAALLAGWYNPQGPGAPRPDILESLDDGIVVLDSVGCILEANTAAARLLDVPSPETIVGRRISRVFPQAPPEISGLARSGPEGGSDPEQPWRQARLPDGRIVAVQVNPVYQTDGYERRVVVLRNVTAQTRLIEMLVQERESIRKRQESAETANVSLLERNVELAGAKESLSMRTSGLESQLRETALIAERARETAELEALRLQVVIDQLPDGLLIVEGDQSGDPAKPFVARIAAVNSAARRFWPIPLDPGRGMRPESLAAWPAEAELFAAAVDKTLLEMRAVVGVRATMAGTDGATRSLTFSVAPLCRSGKVAAVAMIHDSSEYAAELLVRAEFVSVASHELRAPLTVIRGYVQSLLDQIQRDQEEVAPGEQEQNLRAIERQTSRMLALVNDLLDVSRMEAGRFSVSPEPTVVVAFLEHVFRDMQEATQSHRFVYEFEPDLQFAVALWDQYRVEQVISNLVQNAVKHGPEGSVIGVRVRRESAAAVRISVSDEGPGLKEENLERVFERYYQASGEHSTGGMGLGLYISREIVSAHHGRIWVESTPGSGATFIFTLPIETDPDAD